jgi:hypothetical protein
MPAPSRDGTPRGADVREDRARAVGLARILHGELMLLQRVVDTVAA